MKAYPFSLQKCIENGEPLHANRKGIVPLNAESDKPTITPSEMVQFRRLGLSFKQIGKKLGVDPHKEEVMQVYRAIEEATSLDIEKDVRGPTKVSPTNPLWYTFRSEREVIAESVVPRKEDVLSLLPQHRVKQRLGEHAGFMLGVYRQVQTIVHEEILSSIKGASPRSQIGLQARWIEDLPSSICNSIFSLEEAVGEEAFELTQYWSTDAGRCKCSAIKIIRFGWKTSPIPYPSFFWGCFQYTPIESHSHDKGIPIKKSCWVVLGPNSDNRGLSAHISDAELARLENKFTLVDEFWSEDIQDLEDGTIEQHVRSASTLYGGQEKELPLRDISSVRKAVTTLRDQIKYLKDERVAAVVRQED